MTRHKNTNWTENVPEQLSFSLPARAALGRGDFLVGAPNRAALQSIDNWRDWPGRKLILIGPAGSGKSHLAHVWATEANARILSVDQIHEVLGQPFAKEATVVVEDADEIHDADQELALLGLHNLVQEARGWLMVTAQNPVSDWGLSLPDLKSRMDAAGMARLDNPDDALLQGVLVKLFDDRQLRIDPSVVAYLVSRIERSFASAQAVVDAVDRAALTEKRAITRPFAAEIIEKHGKLTGKPPS